MLRSNRKLELGCHEQPRPQPEAKNRTTSSNATLAWGAPSKLQMVRIKGDYLMALPLYIGWTSGTTIIYWLDPTCVSPSLLKDAQTWGALQSILVHLLRRQTFLKLVPQELPPRFKALQQCRMKALAPWTSWRKGGSRCRRSRLPRRSQLLMNEGSQRTPFAFSGPYQIPLLTTRIDATKRRSQYLQLHVIRVRNPDASGVLRQVKHLPYFQGEAEENGEGPAQSKPRQRVNSSTRTEE